jgi:hypothetical protein
MADVTITDVMRAYANDAVAYALRAGKGHLDFSERSLEDVEQILTEQVKSGLLVPDALSVSERNELWGFCKMMGGYVGEVIIRNIGGDWQTKDLEDGSARVVLVTAGVEGSPPEAIWRVLTEPYKGIVSYYRGLRVALGHGEERLEGGFRSVRLPPLSAEPPPGN